MTAILRLAAAGALAAVILSSCGVARLQAVPECEGGRELVTLAQSVPSAQQLPCVADDLPTGWNFASIEVQNGETRFSLSSDRAGVHAVDVHFTETCDLTGSTPVEGSPGIDRHFRIDSLSPTRRGAWLHVFPGGCVTYDFLFPTSAYDFGAFELDVQSALNFYSRAQLADEVSEQLDLDLDS